MNIRCDLHLNGEHRKLVLAGQESETAEHMALKLAAYVLFWAMDPKLQVSLKHPALQGQVFKPDVMALDESGAIALWVECGRSAMHKLDKLTRRYPKAKVVALLPSEDAAKRLRADVGDQLDRGAVLEIWGWPKEAFQTWLRALTATDQVFIVGETEGRSLNLVLNETPIDAELLKF